MELLVVFSAWTFSPCLLTIADLSRFPSLDILYYPTNYPYSFVFSSLATLANSLSNYFTFFLRSSLFFSNFNFSNVIPSISFVYALVSFSCSFSALWMFTNSCLTIASSFLLAMSSDCRCLKELISWDFSVNSYSYFCFCAAILRR